MPSRINKPMSKGTLRTCSRGHEFRKSSDCPVCPKCWSGYYKDKKSGDFPKTSAPALRALLNANITSMAKLAKHTENDVADLHGMGPKALGILKKALAQKGLSLRKG